jgi:hypothetical protein
MWERIQVVKEYIMQREHLCGSFVYDEGQRVMDGLGPTAPRHVPTQKINIAPAPRNRLAEVFAIAIS